MPYLRPFFRVVARILSYPIKAAARVTTEGVLFLLLALVCGVISLSSSPWSNIPLLMCLVLLSLWILAMWQGERSLRGLQLRRNHVERMFANDNITVGLSLANDSAWPCAGLVISEAIENEDGSPVAGIPVASEKTDKAGKPEKKESAPRAAPPRPPVASAGTFVTLVAGKGAERVKYTLTMRRRGIYRFGDTTLQTEAPLGFFRSSATRATPGKLIVYPRMGEIDAGFFKELDLALDHIRRSRPSRAEEDFRGMREYRQGDNPRWIHWKSSARNQKMLVKEFEEPQARRVLLLLDTNLQRVGAQRFVAFESAISFAGTVARDLARRGCEVECVALQPQNRVARMTISRERRNLDGLLEMLAGLKRDDRRTLAHLADHVGRRNLHRAYVIVLGLGSLRGKTALSWLGTGDNAVRMIDARSDEFRRIFHRTTGSARDEDDDMLLGLDEEEVEETVPVAV